MFLLLEDNDVILLENIVALVRREGRTVITFRDGKTRESAFTPLTLGRRSARFARGMAVKRIGREQTKWTEDN